MTGNPAIRYSGGGGMGGQGRGGTPPGLAAGSARAARCRPRCRAPPLLRAPAAAATHTVPQDEDAHNWVPMRPERGAVHELGLHRWWRTTAQLPFLAQVQVQRSGAPCRQQYCRRCQKWCLTIMQAHTGLLPHRRTSRSTALTASRALGIRCPSRWRAGCTQPKTGRCTRTGDSVGAGACARAGGTARCYWFQ